MALLCLISCSTISHTVQTMGLTDSDEEEMAAALGPKRLPALNAGDKTAGAVMMEKGQMPSSQNAQNMGMNQMGTLDISGQSPVLYQAPPESSLQNVAPQQSSDRSSPTSEEKPGLWGKTKNLFGMGGEEEHTSSAKPQEYPLLNQTPDNPAIVPVEVRHQAMDELQFQQKQNETLRQDFMKNGENTFIGQTPPVGTSTSALNYAMPVDGDFVPKVAPVQLAPEATTAMANTPAPDASLMVALPPADSTSGYMPPVARITNTPSADVVLPAPTLPAPAPASQNAYTPLVNGKPSVLPPPPSPVAAPRSVDLVVPPALSGFSDAPSYAPQTPVKDLSSYPEQSTTKEHQGDISLGSPVSVPVATPVASVPGLPSPSSFDDEAPRASRLLAPSRYADRVE